MKKIEPLTKEKKEIERILILLSHTKTSWTGNEVTLNFLSPEIAEEFQTLFEKHKEKLLELSGSPLLELLTTKKEMRIEEKIKKKIKQRIQWLLKEIEKKCKEWEAMDYYGEPTWGEVEEELKNLVKKAFSGVLEE